MYVWQEPDAEDFPERIGRDLPDLRVIVAPEGVKDISDAHVEGREVVALVDELRASALPLSEIVARRHEARLPDLRALPAGYSNTPTRLPSSATPSRRRATVATWAHRP